MPSNPDIQKLVDIDLGGTGSEMSGLKEKESRSEIVTAVEEVPVDHATTRALLRKLDLRLIPFLALIYL